MAKTLIRSQQLNIDSNGLILPAPESNNPAAPSSGNIRLAGFHEANFSQLMYTTSDSQRNVLQPSFYTSSVSWWRAQGNIGTVGNNQFGLDLVSVNGLTSSNVATDFQSNRIPKVECKTTATANTINDLRHQYDQFSIGTGTVGVGGFYFIAQYNINSNVSTQRHFIGLKQAGASSNVDPSTLTNCIGFGANSTGTGNANTWVYYGGSAAQTPIDLGAGFPSKSSSADYYTLILYAPAIANNTVYYKLIRTNGTSTTGTLTAANVGTQLPDPTTLLTPHFYIGNGGTASVASMMLYYMYIQRNC